MIIVSNTTPLSELAKISRLDLLQALFGKILIPPPYAELLHPSLEGQKFEFKAEN